MRCFHSLRRKRKNEFFDSRKKAQDVRWEVVGCAQENVVLVWYYRGLDGGEVREDCGGAEVMFCF